MRIIAGKLGGRQFEGPKASRTHPMSERVRGGLFNALGDIGGLTFLDAFSGSGALAFEAVSRGAAYVVTIEIDKAAHSNIIKSIKTLNIHKQNIKAIRANASGWSDNNPDARFDIIFSAPPYDDLQLERLQKLTRHLSQNGLYILDWPGKLPLPTFGGLELVNQKTYGDAQLAFYRRS